MKKKALSVVIFALSIFIALLIAEGFTRIMQSFGPCYGHSNEELAQSRGFSLDNAHYRPNSQVHHCNADFNYIYNIDSDGLRLSANANQSILSIGDSFTFGFGVPDDKNYSYLVNSKNGGLWGNTFDTQYKSYLRNIELFSPKTIIWTIYPPHLISMTNSNWSKNCPGDLEIFLDSFGVGEHFLAALQSPFVKKSSLYQLILNKLGLFSIVIKDNKIFINKNCYETKEVILYDKNIKNTKYLPIEVNSDIDKELDDSYAKFSLILNEASLVAKKNGIQLLFIIMPSKYYLSSNNEKFITPPYPGYIFDRDLAKEKIINLIIEAGMSKKNILDISSLGELNGTGWKRYYFPRDAHLNEYGNELIANYISKVLKK
jgi:hypothetical protein